MNYDAITQLIQRIEQGRRSNRSCASVSEATREKLAEAGRRGRL